MIGVDVAVIGTTKETNILKILTVEHTIDENIENKFYLHILKSKLITSVSFYLENDPIIIVSW